jgi:hypothetical protein
MTLPDFFFSPNWKKKYVDYTMFIKHNLKSTLKKQFIYLIDFL